MNERREGEGTGTATDPARRGLEDLEAKLGYAFQDRNLLLEAFTHRSLINELPGADRRDNERLEFLGDAVLGLLISEWLMERFPVEQEGELTRLRSSLVKEKRLAEVARGLGLGSHLHLGKGEEMLGGRSKPSILADALEALLGALYLDGGPQAARNLVRERFRDFLEGMTGNRLLLADPKTRLQELFLALFRVPPAYGVIGEEGPDHEKTFSVGLWVQGHRLASGKGRSKKEAEQDAAEQFLRSLQRNPLALL